MISTFFESLSFSTQIGPNFVINILFDMKPTVNKSILIGMPMYIDIKCLSSI